MTILTANSFLPIIYFESPLSRIVLSPLWSLSRSPPLDWVGGGVRLSVATVEVLRVDLRILSVAACLALLVWIS